MRLANWFGVIDYLVQQRKVEVIFGPGAPESLAANHPWVLPLFLIHPYRLSMSAKNRPLTAGRNGTGTNTQNRESTGAISIESALAKEAPLEVFESGWGKSPVADLDSQVPKQD